MIYPPRPKLKVDSVECLKDLPEDCELEDYNEFYRLYKSNKGKLYLYKVKRPNSPLNEHIRDQTRVQ